MGAAMEMDVWEFESATVNDNHRCRIVSNATGRQLRLRLIGVDGSVVATCITPVNGPCALPVFIHVANLLFQCTVATANGQPVLGGNAAFYRIGIARP
jgi:hypothetical protein